MENRIDDIITKIQSGNIVAMGSLTKNHVNAVLADKFKVGDHVQVIKTGQTGTITKKVVYGRSLQKWVSPHGYTAIQVDIDGVKHNYAPKSLRAVR